MGYYGKFYTNKFDKLNKMDKFLQKEKCNLLILALHKMENLKTLCLLKKLN